MICPKCKSEMKDFVCDYKCRNLNCNNIIYKDDYIKQLQNQNKQDVMMDKKLRYFQVYDENGRDSPTYLQYWDEEEKIWADVPFIRTSVRNEEEYMHDKNAC
jgi:hypothetical protein